MPGPQVILHASGTQQEPGEKQSGVRLCGQAGRKQQEQLLGLHREPEVCPGRRTQLQDTGFLWRPHDAR